MKTKCILILSVIFFGLFVPACSSETPASRTETPVIDTGEEAAPAVAATNTQMPTPPPTDTSVPLPSPSPSPSPDPSPTIETAPVKVLFIGSSHIFHGPTGHNLPGMFTWLAESGGHNIDVDKSAESGVWLSDHLEDKRTVNLLRNEEWDYVILQEDMYMGAREDGRQEDMYPAIRALNEEIINSGAETILFNTWVNPAPIYAGDLDEYLANQALLSEGYQSIAGELELRVAPVDQAIIRSLEERPDLYFWVEGDEHGHANFMGSYLTAAVFYAMIFQESPEGLSFVYSPEETSIYLQSIAAQTVFDNPSG